jgi:hypothetical protein
VRHFLRVWVFDNTQSFDTELDNEVSKRNISYKMKNCEWYLTGKRNGGWLMKEGVQQVQ